MRRTITSRLRRNKAIRDLVSETSLMPDKFVFPIFVKEHGEVEASRWGGMEKIPLSGLLERISNYVESGIRSFLIFGIPSSKDPLGTAAYSKDGVTQRAIRMIKESFSAINILTDVCLCQYTDHGHCGIVEGGKINRSKTLSILSRIAVSHAEAGADIVAPSAMMDGQVLAIREALDEAGFYDLGIMSYSTKYRSYLYSPFRDVASSAPTFGDRSSYQMDFRNRREAVIEAVQDIKEGADIVMVKPAMPYLDIISDLRRILRCPLAAYQVSGEYVMIREYCKSTGTPEREVLMETLIAIKRAGADIIISYFSPEAIGILREGCR
ncbi:MAG: porphobilinogen synthase [Candidatus Methanomethyliaceae archaeon]